MNQLPSKATDFFVIKRFDFKSAYIPLISLLVSNKIHKQNSNFFFKTAFQPFETPGAFTH